MPTAATLRLIFVPWQVLVHHGAKRSSDLEVLRQADVILTTYSTIENDYRR